jgi:anti-anti-sigma factor
VTALSPARPVGSYVSSYSEETPCRVEAVPAGLDGIRVIRLSGVPGMRDSRRVHEVVAAALLDAPKAVVIDMNGVDRLDDDGVMLLALVRRHVRRLGPVLPLAGVTPAVTRSLRMFDLNGLFQLYTTVTEAVLAKTAKVEHDSRAAYVARANRSAPGYAVGRCPR